MNLESLLNAIVRQTVILIAQLATHGTRAPLAHVADQVFMSLVNELRQRGLSHRAVAHMFSLPLSTYHDRIRRFSVSETTQSSLWKAVLDHIQEHEPITQAKLLFEFRRDNADDIKGVLQDLMKARLISKTGQGLDSTYEITSEKSRMAGSNDPVQAAASLVWVAVNGHSPARREDIERLVPMEDALLNDAIEELVEQGRLMEEVVDGELVWSCDSCVIPFDSSIGWEAAVFDHYQTMVKAILNKLERGKQARFTDVIGGSTYKFYLSEEHPMRTEVLALLQETRARAGALRERVTQYNKDHALSAEDMDEVLFYTGQTVIPRSRRGGEDEA